MVKVMIAVVTDEPWNPSGLLYYTWFFSLAHIKSSGRGPGGVAAVLHLVTQGSRLTRPRHLTTLMLSCVTLLQKEKVGKFTPTLSLLLALGQTSCMVLN